MGDPLALEEAVKKAFIAGERGNATNLCLSTSIRQDEFSAYLAGRRSLSDRKVLEMINWSLLMMGDAWKLHQ